MFAFKNGEDSVSLEKKSGSGWSRFHCPEAAAAPYGLHTKTEKPEPGQGKLFIYIPPPESSCTTVCRVPPRSTDSFLLHWTQLDYNVGCASASE